MRTSSLMSILFYAEGVRGPPRIGKHDVLEVVVAEEALQAEGRVAGTGDPHRPVRGNVCFSARAIAWEDPRRPGEDLLDRFDFVGRQATGRVRCAARQLFGLEVACRRIVQELVGAQTAVMPRALRQRGIAHEVEVGLGQISGARSGERPLVPDEAGQQVSPIVGRRPRYNAVEVARKPLCLHQRFTASVRAPHEVGSTSAARFEGHDERLGDVGGLFQRAVSEVDNLLRMPGRPARIDATGLMAVIGCGDRITSLKRVGHSAGRRSHHRSRRSRLKILQVPSRFRDPHFEIDVRVAGRRRKSCHPAELRQPGNRLGGTVGVTNVPAGTVCAVVMVVFGRWKLLASCEHVVAEAGEAANPIAAAAAADCKYLRFVAGFVRPSSFALPCSGLVAKPVDESRHDELGWEVDADSRHPFARSGERLMENRSVPRTFGSYCNLPCRLPLSQDTRIGRLTDRPKVHILDHYFGHTECYGATYGLQATLATTSSFDKFHRSTIWTIFD